MMTRYSMWSYIGSELRKKIDIKDNIIIMKFEYGLWFHSSFFLDSPYWSLYSFSSVQSLSLCLTLCDTMNRSTQGLPVHHQIPEFIQTHVHWVNDAIQPSHPLLPSSPPAFRFFQHQCFFPMNQLFASGG